MTPAADTHLAPGQACMVFPADAIFVSAGVNQGEPLSLPDEICLGDIYELDHAYPAERLVVARDSGQARVGPGSAAGIAGAALDVVSRYTLMGDDGNRVDLLLLRLGGGPPALYALPLSPMAAGVGYALVKAEAAPENAPLADLLCMSFARGTHIALADGNQRAIEDLRAGDRVLTRDHGPQELRWVGHVTLRALGPFAPVVITAGAMGNAGDLIVSQQHRMFLYERRRAPGLPTSELLVQARDLVNGDTIFLRDGAFIDYFSLVFDRHEIIYAEGIPAESLLVTEAVLSCLPRPLAREVAARFPGLSQRQHFGTEAGRHLLETLAPRQR